MLDDNGRVSHMYGTHQDVTETKLAELALEDQVRQNTLMQAVASAANEAGTLVEVLSHARLLVLLHDDWERGRAFLPDEDGTGVVPLHITDDDRLEDAATPEQTALELALATRAFREKRSVWDDARPYYALFLEEPDAADAGLVIAGFTRAVVEECTFAPPTSGSGPTALLLPTKGMKSELTRCYFARGAIGVAVQGPADLKATQCAFAPQQQAVVRVTPVDIFPNCPRNIPRMQVVEASPYVPRCGVERVEPAWKSFESFADAVPPRRA